MCSESTPNTSVVLIDTEYTTWEGAMQRNWSGANEHREVVQVAACGLSPDSREIVWSASWYTLPVRNPVLSDYFTSLTKITQDEVNAQNVPLHEILDRLVSLVENRPLFCWGDGDEGSLRESCKIQGLLYPDSLSGIFDIREYFSSAGIETAMYQSGTVHKAIGITMDAKQHNAMHDVWSMFATIRSLVLSERSVPLQTYLSERDQLDEFANGAAT